MIGSVGSNLSAQGFYPEAPARLQRFRDVFGQVPLRVVLTVRALPDYWTSALTYAVATGRKFPDAPTLEALSQAQRGWADLARETARVFPQSQVLVADYAEWATRPDAFLALLAGRPVGTLPRRMARHHVSPLLDGLRKRLAGRGDAAGLELLGTGTGKWQPFSAAQLQRLGAQHAADMAKLATGLTGARLVHPPAEG